MMRSLFSGISGLKNHQVRMDVVGNNIANVNTVGYKAGRVSFEESLSQLMAGARRPQAMGDGVGGTNPMQVGLGSGTASVDNMFTQGNLERTGQVTDLAIEGQAFFVVANGEGGLAYTRNGAFRIDGRGNLVMPSNGFALQGIMADENGLFSPVAPMESIRIPFDTASPASATTRVQLGRNLDADSFPLGTVTHSQRFLTYPTGTTTLSDAYTVDGQGLGLLPGNTITFSARNPGTGAEVTDSLTVAAGTTLSDLLAAAQTFLNSQAGAGGATLALDAQGQVVVTAGSANLTNFSVLSDTAAQGALLSDALRIPTTLAAGSTFLADGFRRSADASTLLADTFSQNGNSLGLQAGDPINFSGQVGDAFDPASSLIYDPATTSIEDLLDAVRDQLRLPVNDGTVENNPTVSINALGSNDNIPDGTIVIRGLSGNAFSLDNIGVVGTNSNAQSPTPAVFNANMAFTEVQAARDTGVVSAPITIYDQLGFPHNLVMTFTHSGSPDEWVWEASVGGNAEVLAGNRGRVYFGPDGTVTSFIYDDDQGALRVDPGNGSNLLEVQLDPGGLGEYGGLTQFRAPSTASALQQDGYTMGRLEEIAVNSLGVVMGQFSNGISRDIARLVVADFTNPAGLSKASESVYLVSSNSGDPVYGNPGDESTSVIRPGTLEMANVDLSQEFTSMITTQRGYQANARVITTSDRFLEELVNLAR